MLHGVITPIYQECELQIGVLIILCIATKLWRMKRQPPNIVTPEEAITQFFHLEGGNAFYEWRLLCSRDSKGSASYFYPRLGETLVFHEVGDELASREDGEEPRKRGERIRQPKRSRWL